MWPDPSILLKLSFLTTADTVSRMKISVFPKMLARSRILLKIVIFDHRGHEEDELKCQFFLVARSKTLLKIVIFDHRRHVQARNFIFSNKCGPIQDFAQNCIFDQVLVKADNSS